MLSHGIGWGKDCRDPWQLLTWFPLWLGERERPGAVEYGKVILIFEGDQWIIP